MIKFSGGAPKRLRPRAPRNEHTQASGQVAPWEHVRLFTQLFDEGGGGGGASLAGHKASTQVSMIQALTDQIVPRVLGASQWPLVAVLYLPRLGRINASVRREQGAWDIELAAEEASTAQWLGGVRQRFQEELTQSLGVPVRVNVASVGSA